MGAEPLRLDALLESVADGTSVDWVAADAVATEGERKLLRHLRLVAGIAEVHRTMPFDEPKVASPQAHRPADAEAEEPIPRWGHLLLLDVVGEGAFGEVYRARDAWLDRHVALKLLKPTPTGPARLIAEAQAMARVRHPNVVTVHGADIHDGRVGLWMEFVHGRTLSEIVTSEGPFSGAEAALIGQELCKALAAVHAVGLVHRDIKAQNVMRESGGRLVLMDFGAGYTPLYAAPELIDGEEATVAGDIYALGVLLYYLVTGKYPVVGTSLNELQRAHRSGERQPLARVRPELPVAFVAAVERALHPDPARRFAGAAEMEETIAQAAGATSASRVAVLAQAPAWVFRLSGRFWWACAVAVLATIAGLLSWRARDSESRTGSTGISVIAVLPFENLSKDPAEGYLANAVPMELTARLGAIGTLRVVPWTFTSRFHSSTLVLDDVVKATRADALVEGSVQVLAPSGATAGAQRVRVRVQLYRAGTGALLWTDSYERNLSDFLALQSDIAQAIATQVNAVVARREQMRLSRARRVTPAAMEDYLRGREAFEGRYDIRTANALFQSAVNREEDFAEAYAGLGLTYALESAYLGAIPSRVAHARALTATNRAVALDPEMPEAYAARAFAHMALAWDWNNARADLEKALALDPNAADVHSEYSTYLTYHARHDEAIAAARKAEERAPMSAVYSRKVGWALYMARRYDEAIDQLRRTLDIEPGYVPAQTVLGRTYMLVGRFDDGIRELETAGQGHEAKLALCLALAGRRDDAMTLLHQLTSPSYTSPVDPYELAVIYAALGNQAEALKHLERAYREHDPALAFIRVDPMLDPLRPTPEFQAIAQDMNLQH